MFNNIKILEIILKFVYNFVHLFTLARTFYRLSLCFNNISNK